jgi:MarR family transcriptional regulator, transcriptional regulator for hemolysin
VEQQDAERLTRHLAKVSQLVRAVRAADLHPHGLHPGQDVLVWLLGRHRAGLTVRDIAEQLGIDGPSVTRSLARLDDQGWFVRRPVPGDRRQVLVVPTARTVDLADEMESSWGRVAHLACAGISERDQQRFLSTLDLVMTNLAAAAKSAP